MLAGMRNTVQQGLTTVIFGAIIVVFALNFGPGSASQCSGKVPVAAQVGSRVIPEADFVKAYSRRFQMIATQSPGFNVEAAKAQGLKKMVLDEMIGNEILAQEAERRGLAVGPEELKAYILKQPYFQTDGKFDKDLYMRITRANFLSATKYEELVTRELLITKMHALLQDLTQVSPVDIKEQWASQNDRANIEFVRFDPAFYRKGVQVTDEAVAKLAADEPQAVEAYYKEHAARYNEPRKVRARHILIKVTDSAPEADVAKAKERIEAAKARLDKGEDFAALAKEFSEDGSAQNGGDLGLQGPGVWVKPFEDEANRLKPGEVGNIIRSAFGFHIIKVEEVKEKVTRSLDEVKTEVARLVLEDRLLKEAAKAAAEDVLKAAKAGKALTAQFPPPADDTPTVGDPLKPKLEESGMFSRGGKYIPRLGISESLSAAVFERKAPGFMDTIMEVNNRFYVINVKERVTPDDEKFEAEREEVEERARTMARMSAVRDFVAQRRKEYDGAHSIRIEGGVLDYDSQLSGTNTNEF